jgi:hypothetical protein
MVRDLAGADMTNTTLVFALQLSYWDASPESASTEVRANPDLEVFSNTTLAAASKEGINIVEGDLWFFAADGSPLEAVFSEQPYVDNERLKYFAGKYSLHAGRGKTLRQMISNVLSDYPPLGEKIIVRVAASDEVAQKYGWSDVEEMRSNVDQALEAAVPDLAKLVEFDLLAVRL